MILFRSYRSIAVSLYFFEKTALGFAILAGIGLPAFFKSRFNVNEILSSLMLNYIAFLLLAYLVQGYLKTPMVLTSLNPNYFILLPCSLFC